MFNEVFMNKWHGNLLISEVNIFFDLHKYGSVLISTEGELTNHK